MCVEDRPPFEIQRIAFGTSGEGRSLWTAELDSVLTGLSADGRRLVYNVRALETGADIWTGSVDRHEPAQAVRATVYEELFAAFSPDGRWLVCVLKDRSCST